MAKKIPSVENTGFTPDKKDLEILRILEKNAKATVREIAAKVHLSSTPVHERIKQMEEAGVIQQYRTVINPTTVGRGLTVICYVSLKDHNKKAGAAFINAIMQMQEVTECYNISGEFDFMLKVMVADMNSYYNFHVNQLSEADNIGHVQSIFVMGVIKQNQQLVT